MKHLQALLIMLLLSCAFTSLYARGWSACTETVNCCAFESKPIVSAGKKADVIPLGYPYGNDWSSRPYLAPFARPAPYQFGQPFTFGYVAVESTPVKKPMRKKKRVHSKSAVSDC